MCFFYASCFSSLVLFFFFQAEDGIRDGRVTGVQTCALPIWPTGWIQTGRCHSSSMTVGGPNRAFPRDPSMPLRRVPTATCGSAQRLVWFVSMDGTSDSSRTIPEHL